MNIQLFQINTNKAFKVKPSQRSRQRGALLVIVLGLLVVLSLIGIAFGYLVIAEQRSSENALNRFKAVSAAEDGEAYAVARLRSQALQRHYEGEGSWSFNTHFDPAGQRIGPDGTLESYQKYLERYAENSKLDSDQLIVSFSKAGKTNSQKKPDYNWVDFNGNGRIDSGEDRLASDLMASAEGRKVLKRVSYFVGDGIDLSMYKSGIEGGSYRELGDRASLKIIDTNSQLNINDFGGIQLAYMLQVLGNEIALLLGDPAKNPFPLGTVEEIVRFQEQTPGGIRSKNDLRQFFDDSELYHFTMDLIAVKSWPQRVENSTQPYFASKRNPALAEKIDDREQDNFVPKAPFRDTYGNKRAAGQSGTDGNAEIQPEGERSERSPVNINTVTKPVLTAMLAGLEAEARFLYYPKLDRITREDQYWLNELGVSGPQQMLEGTTDAAMQPIIEPGRPNDESNAALSNHTSLKNLASYQAVPVGPLGYNVAPAWKSGGYGSVDILNPWVADGSEASNLADAILREREERGPFRSWMDFDYRICHQILSGFQAGVSENSADLVNTGRSNRLGSLPRSLAHMPAGKGQSLLPDPGAVDHPVSGKNQSSQHSYSAQEFDAWYWRACVDMIRANFNPNGYLNKTNPDSAYYTSVDTTDLKYATAPLCFSSMGVYEITSQGEVAAIQLNAANRGSSLEKSQSLDFPLARRTVRSIVEVYTTFEHTTQKDFLTSIDPDSFKPQSKTTSVQQGKETTRSVVTHDLYGTQTYPNSIDHGIYGYRDQITNERNKYFGTPIGALDDNGKLLTLYRGYYSSTAADERFGWVGLYPQDRTPNAHLRTNEQALNFHAHYSYSLEGLSDLSNGNQHRHGHVPYSEAAEPELAHTVSSASPHPNQKDTQGWKGYEAAADRHSAEAARYATLRPDGVLLRGWHLNPIYRTGGSGAKTRTFGVRRTNRMSRLASLRYRAGAAGASPFAPINGKNPDDSKQVLPGKEFDQPPHGVAVRLFGQGNGATPGEGGGQGTDQHNIEMQSIRQTETNFPYYEGWVDFWIKWELPPQGKSGKVVSAGEIDPGSGNFSGLLGATSYGRMMRDGASQNDKEVAYDRLGIDTDFEGAEFFIFKEPGGILRISHLYFTRAYTATYSSTTGPGGYIPPTGSEQMGNRARITGKQVASADPATQEELMVFDEYVGSNDIASASDDLGFSYARTESYVDLSELPGNSDVNLVTHNWYRFTLKYRSNSRNTGVSDPTRPPHELFIDGRTLPLIFKEPSLSDQHAVNTGEITDTLGSAKNFTWNSSSDEEYIIHRSSTALLEVDPEDRLTIGCLTRRQDPTRLDAARINNDPSVQPLFLFDSNLVAPANATLDDVRIFHQLSSSAAGSTGAFTESEYRDYSRYQSIPSAGGGASQKVPELRGTYENGFLAGQIGADTFQLFPAPVRVASIAWTEYRPFWDSYGNKRLDGSAENWANAPHISLGFEVVPNILAANETGGIVEYVPGSFSETNREDLRYWNAGGYSLESLAGQPVYLMNDISRPEQPSVAMLKYQAFFINPTKGGLKVLNSSPVLDDVRITLMTPPRRLVSEEVFK